MTDKEIIKHLEWLVLVGERIGSVTIGGGDVAVLLDLINRQQAEIERLERILNTRCEHCPRDNTTLVKEFAERLTHTLVEENTEYINNFDFAYTLETIDAVKKEMTEDNY